MPDNISEEVLSRLDALAAKMGTTVEYLWTVLVTDASRRGLYMAIAFVVFGLAIGLIGSLVGRRIIKSGQDVPEKSMNSHNYSTSPQAARYVGGWIMIIISAVLTISFCGGSIGWLSDYLAPNMAAMEVVSDLLR